MKKYLLKIWRLMPDWLQEAAGFILRPRFQVVVGALILNKRGQLLLCEHTYRRTYPWGLPGGDLNFGEDPVDGIKRELYEETGLLVGKLRLILVDNSTERKHIVLTFLCSDVTGEFKPNDEVARIGYFNIDDLPEFDSMQQVTIDRALMVLQSVGESGQ